MLSKSNMKEQKRHQHPGWAVKFTDGSWLSGGHGWHQHADAFYASIFSSFEAAKEAVETSELYDPKVSWEIISAWEPLCERLRHDVIILRQVNKIKPLDIMNLRMDLEDILNTVKKLDSDEEEDFK